MVTTGPLLTFHIFRGAAHLGELPLQFDVTVRKRHVHQSHASPKVEKAMLTPSLVCAYWMRGSIAHVFYNTQGFWVTLSANSVRPQRFCTPACRIAYHQGPLPARAPPLPAVRTEA